MLSAPVRSKKHRAVSRSGSPSPAARPAVICVDLDGTLVHTDLLAEAAIAAIRQNILVMFLLPFWLLRGKAVLKRELARRTSVNASLLPYNEELLSYLVERKADGCSIWLTTASDRQHAELVAQHLGIFDKVVASDGTTNLNGKRKLTAILEALGTTPFSYAGNARPDLDIWQGAANAICVNTPHAVENAIRHAGIPVEARFASQKSRLKLWIKALRLYQWSKNLLVFVPMVLGHQLQSARIAAGCLAFFTFSLCASAFYLLNDLLDLEGDRAHPRKRKRPFASGQLPIASGVAGLLAITAADAILAYFLPLPAQLFLGLYAVLNFAYSARLKQILCLDVVVLAFLYTLRILFGGAATHITVSIWTLVFSVFLFLGLALLKRLTELHSVANTPKVGESRRPYIAADLATVLSFASSALYLAVFVLAFYLNSPEVTKLYSRPEALWLVCLGLIYWVSRMLTLTNRGHMTDDPIVFSFKDRPSQIVFVLTAGCVAFAI